MMTSVSPALAFRFALREMRAGLRGFLVFIACIALGTAAIAGINSVSATIRETMASQGQQLLAADIRFELTNRQATQEERAYLESLGTLSHSTTLRSMLRRADSADQALAEIKAVDGAYPLYGTVTTEEGGDFASLVAKRDGLYGALLPAQLLDRLNLRTGDRLLLGNATVRVAGTLKSEPDAVSEGFAFAPRLLMSEEGLAETGLVQLGSLTREAYRIRLEGPVDQRATAAAGLRKRTETTFPNAGFAIRTSTNAAPSLAENIGRFTQFLTLVGLTALIVGGVGIGNAVRAYLDSKRATIATFKCLGAPARLIILIYFIQIMLVALAGIAIGLIIGAIAPLIANPYLATVLPVDESIRLFPRALALAAGFGLLTTITFSILPLGIARSISAVTLLREGGNESRRWPSWQSLLALAASLSLLAGLAIYTAADRRVAMNVLVAIAIGFVGLRLVGIGIAALARHAPRFRSPALRLAVGNIHRPGALTGPVVLSLGLGLALLVSLSLIDVNLRQQLTGTLAAKAPNFFFIDIQAADREGFENRLREQAPGGKIEAVPMLRGRLVALNGVDVDKAKIAPEGKWVLSGDRGITYAAALPSGSSLTEGSWWDEDYAGEPLVSFSAEEAANLNLKRGDSVTVNVLGRQITAKIANLRKVDWDSMSINFVMIFSPNTFRGAPHSWLASLSDPTLAAADEGKVLRIIVQTYPAVTSIRVKDALDTVASLTGRLANAIRAAAAIALVTSILVLAGALAAGNRARQHDAVVLKTLGATRQMLTGTYVLEYAILGLATALFATAAGGLSAWYVIQKIMKLPFALLPGPVMITLALGLLITVTIGLAGTWRVLGQKASQHLREL